jgi:hypothetical protein
MPVIRVDNEVMDRIKFEAEQRGLQFTTPNNMLRIMLELEPLKGPRHESGKKEE